MTLEELQELAAGLMQDAARNVPEPELLRGMENHSVVETADLTVSWGAAALAEVRGLDEPPAALNIDPARTPNAVALLPKTAAAMGARIMAELGRHEPARHRGIWSELAGVTYWVCSCEAPPRTGPQYRPQPMYTATEWESHVLARCALALLQIPDGGNGMRTLVHYGHQQRLIEARLARREGPLYVGTWRMAEPEGDGEAGRG